MASEGSASVEASLVLKTAIRSLTSAVKRSDSAEANYERGAAYCALGQSGSARFHLISLDGVVRGDVEPRHVTPEDLLDSHAPVLDLLGIEGIPVPLMRGSDSQL